MDRKPVKKKRSPPKGENPGTAFYEAVGRTLMGCSSSLSTSCPKTTRLIIFPW